MINMNNDVMSQADYKRLIQSRKGKALIRYFLIFGS
jgi:hypothetical protein